MVKTIRGFILKFITDFHIHSHFSMATSSKLVPEYLEYWARLKGINVIGTGDCIHPGWQQELEEKLEPAGNGLFKLKDHFRLDESRRLRHEHIPDEVYFILTGEISSIYKRDGKVRKVHNVCVFPDMDSLIKVQRRLDDIGNIRSDGRPILGLDSRIILEMVLESSDKSFLIPAHIWTPWFSVLGSKSGFDTIDECYGDLTRHIFAVETGLSSDPPMNRVCSFLDRFRLVSNSDAHSPEKLGREANIFDSELSYDGIYRALKNDDGFQGTIEFYPQEGKYHYDGHRNCGIMWNPLETIKHNGVCPVCGKDVTRGVMYRVAELGDRNIIPEAQKKEFHSITQMPDLIAEIRKQKSSTSKSVMAEYFRLVKEIGSEFHIYLESDMDDISLSGGELLAEGIRRLRAGEVHVTEGFDGEFGTVKVFRQGEMDAFRYSPLFGNEQPAGTAKVKHSLEFNIEEFRELRERKVQETGSGSIPDNSAATVTGLTPEQMAAVTHAGSTCIVVAGPGSGKTRILTERVKYLVSENLALPEQIVALTFSNRAADEMRERIGREIIQKGLFVSTLHSFGLSVIRENAGYFKLGDDFIIISEDEKTEVLKTAVQEKSKNRKSVITEISKYKQGMETGISEEIIDRYRQHLLAENAIDMDDLIAMPVELLSSDESVRMKYVQKIKYLLIDEFQDINAAQYRFIRLLTCGNEEGLFAIGDPDQAIYGFRGSDSRFIDKLKEDYTGIKTFMLSKSFRCPGTVLRAAGQVLDRTQFLSGISDGVKIRVSSSQSDAAEADWIASEIENLVGGVRSFSMDSGISDGQGKGLGFSDFAVLCRASFLIDPVIKAMKNHGIPYQIVDNEPFYIKEPYISVLAEIRRIYTALKKGETVPNSSLKEMITGGHSVLSVILYMLRQKPDVFDEQKVTAYFGQITGYDELFRSVTLRNGTDDYVPEQEAVPVITIHSSKGLEFNTVFIPGCEEGIIPFTLYGNSNADVDEEKRIFYVGITRAKERLYLSRSLKRMYRGRILSLPESGFLEKIEKELTEKRKREQKLQKKDDSQLKLF